MLQRKSLEQQNVAHSSKLSFLKAVNRYILLILAALLCIPQQAEATTIPALAESSQVNASNYRGALVFGQDSGINSTVTVAARGQQVINAIPWEERAAFVMFQLAVTLERIFDNATKERESKTLSDIKEFYGSKLTVLEKVPVYGNFSADLLHWIEQKFNLTHEDVYYQLRSRNLLAYNELCCYCCPF